MANVKLLREMGDFIKKHPRNIDMSCTGHEVIPASLEKLRALQERDKAVLRQHIDSHVDGDEYVWFKDCADVRRALQMTEF